MEQVKGGGMRTRHMTEGDPVKLILAFAIPLFIGNIFQQIYTLADTMVVGHFLGDNAISAIGATQALYNVLLSSIIGMNNGYAIVSTQAFGAKNEERFRRCVAGTYVLNGIMTALVTALSLVFLKPLLRFMNTPESIFEDTYIYIFILCAGFFTTALYNMFAAVLRAVGNSKTPLYALIVACAVNVVLDILLVAVFRMGLLGAALATVTAQLASAIHCGYAVLRHYKPILPKKQDYKGIKPLLPELLSSGVSMALVSCVVNIGNMIFQRVNNTLGEGVIAAFTASHKIINMMFQPLLSLASANTTFISQNYGAGKMDRIRTAIKKVELMELAWGTFAAVLVCLLAKPIITVITGTQDSEVLHYGAMSLYFSMPFLPVLGTLFCLRTTFQSVGSKVIPVMSSIVEVIMKAFGAVIMIPAYGYLGSCITEPLTWTVMTVYLAVSWFAMRKKLLALK